MKKGPISRKKPLSEKKYWGSRILKPHFLNDSKYKSFYFSSKQADFRIEDGLETHIFLFLKPVIGSLSPCKQP